MALERCTMLDCKFANVYYFFSVELCIFLLFYLRRLLLDFQRECMGICINNPVNANDIFPEFPISRFAMVVVIITMFSCRKKPPEVL